MVERQIVASWVESYRRIWVIVLIKRDHQCLFLNFFLP